MSISPATQKILTQLDTNHNGVTAAELKKLDVNKDQKLDTKELTSQGISLADVPAIQTAFAKGQAKPEVPLFPTETHSNAHDAGHKALHKTVEEGVVKGIEHGVHHAAEKALEKTAMAAGEKALEKGAAEAGEAALKHGAMKATARLGTMAPYVGVGLGLGITAYDTHDAIKKTRDKNVSWASAAFAWGTVGLDMVATGAQGVASGAFTSVVGAPAGLIAEGISWGATVLSIGTATASEWLK